MAAQLPPDLGPMDRDMADLVLQFHKGLTLLMRPDGRDPLAAEAIFRALCRRRPNVAAYAVNVIAAQIGALLPDDLFGRLYRRGPARATILADADALANNAANLAAPIVKLWHATRRS